MRQYRQNIRKVKDASPRGRHLARVSAVLISLDATPDSGATPRVPTPAEDMTYAIQGSSEQKLKAIWELAGDAMIFLDADGLLDCNDAALRVLGIDSSEQAVGMPLSAFAPRYQADGRLSA